jgi:hypothetical protein
MERTNFRILFMVESSVKSLFNPPSRFRGPSKSTSLTSKAVYVLCLSGSWGDVRSSQHRQDLSSHSLTLTHSAPASTAVQHCGANCSPPQSNRHFPPRQIQTMCAPHANDFAWRYMKWRGRWTSARFTNWVVMHYFAVCPSSSASSINLPYFFIQTTVKPWFTYSTGQKWLYLFQIVLKSKYGFP